MNNTLIQGFMGAIDHAAGRNRVPPAVRHPSVARAPVSRAAGAPPVHPAAPAAPAAHNPPEAAPGAGLMPTDPDNGPRMSSVDIARLTGKQQAHVMRDIDTMLDAMAEPQEPQSGSPPM